MPLFSKGFDEVEVGEKFGDSLTVTETHVVLAAAAFGDFNALHVDEETARKGIFKGRVAHGPLTAGIMAGALGNYFSRNAIGFLEQTTRFLAPVKPGDTITTQWQIEKKEPKPKYKGGVVHLSVSCKNQRGEMVAEGSGKILLSDKGS